MTAKRRKAAKVKTQPAARPWSAAELPACERDYRTGDRMALAHAIAICASLKRPLPRWAARAFAAGYSSIIGYRAESWESIFGPAKPKGKHLAALRAEHEKSLRVWREIQLRHEAGDPTDDELFAKVGKELGIGTTNVKKYFASARLAIERKMASNDRESAVVRSWVGKRLDAANSALDAGKPESARKLMSSVERRLARFYGVSVSTLMK